MHVSMEEHIFVIVNGLRVKIKMSWTVSAVASSIIGSGGLIFIFSCSALLFLLKSIVFMVCEDEYMNMTPSLNYRALCGIDSNLVGKIL